MPIKLKVKGVFETRVSPNIETVNSAQQLKEHVERKVIDALAQFGSDIDVKVEVTVA